MCLIFTNTLVGEKIFSTVFFCSANFRPSIYSTHSVVSGIIRKLVQRRMHTYIQRFKDVFQFFFLRGVMEDQAFKNVSLNSMVLFTYFVNFAETLMNLSNNKIKQGGSFDVRSHMMSQPALIYIFE